MKGKLAASLVAVAGATLAYCMPCGAADITAQPSLKAPPSAPPYSWNGFYVGSNLGVVTTIEDESINSTFLGAPLTFSSNPSGVLGGVQLGYNLQLSPQWLIGFEGALDWTSAQGIANFGNTIQTATLTANHNWYDTAEGRLGYVMGGYMLFVKGGTAWMNADYSLTANGAVTGSSSINTTRSGWTAGGGIEGLLSSSWSAKLEYDYLDFGNKSYAFPITGSSLNIKPEVHEVKIGVNYHWPAMPLSPF